MNVLFIHGIYSIVHCANLSTKFHTWQATATIDCVFRVGNHTHTVRDRERERASKWLYVRERETRQTLEPTSKSAVARQHNSICYIYQVEKWKTDAADGTLSLIRRNHFEINDKRYTEREIERVREGSEGVTAVPQSVRWLRENNANPPLLNQSISLAKELAAAKEAAKAAAAAEGFGQQLRLMDPVNYIRATRWTTHQKGNWNRNGNGNGNGNGYGNEYCNAGT